MMKTKVAMAISLAGVLAAGTAAALVNTRVLNGGSGSALSAAAPNVQQTSPADAAPTADTTPAVSAPAAGPATSSTQATYAIGDSGTVTLDTAGDVLTISAVAPAPGWIVTQSEAGDRSNAEVRFQAGTIEVDFHANLVYGVVRTSVESHDLSTTNSSIGSNSGFDDGRQSGDDGSGQGGDDDGGSGDD
jgi:hypothetical protein